MMGMHKKDKRGEYKCLHSFVDVRPCHGGGYCCNQQEVRQYADGFVRVVGGPAVYSHGVTPEIVSMMQIYSAARFALVCVAKAPE